MAVDILDRLLEHDADATRHLLTLCPGLSDEQWHRTFDFGQGSVYKTLDHLIDSQEYWTSLLREQPGPFTPALVDPSRSAEGIMRRFEAISPVFRATARQIRDEHRLDALFVDTETGPARRTFGSCIVHVTTHSMHHRAQIHVMFDLMGVEYDVFGGGALDVYPLNET